MNGLGKPCWLLILILVSRLAVAESPSYLALSLDENLQMPFFSNAGWKVGSRDRGTADTTPRITVARNAFSGRDAIAMNIWYPNSNREFIDYRLPTSENGSVWQANHFQYLSFWVKSSDTEGEMEIRLSNKNDAKKRQHPYFATFYVSGGQWQQVVLPLHGFRLWGEGKKPALVNLKQINTISLGYRNQGLQRAGTVLFSHFKVGQFHWNSLMRAITVNGSWQFKLDNARREGVGLAQGWQSERYDASDWNSIKVGMPWERQGYRYNGVAWYRKALVLPQQWQQGDLQLVMGRPNDRGELYWNGVKVAQVDQFGGRFKATIDQSQVAYGRANQIAIRVVDRYREGGLDHGPFTIAPQPYRLLLRERDNPATETAIENYEMGAKPVRSLELVIEWHPALTEQQQLQLSYRVSDCFDRQIKSAQTMLERKPGQGFRTVIALSDDQYRTLFYGEWISIAANLTNAEHAVIFASVDHDIKLKYEDRDALRLGALPQKTESTPYGKLKLIDVIEASVSPQQDEHPYKEGGIRDSWIGRCAYQSWKNGISVKYFQDKPYREANNGQHFLYRIGRGQLKPHQGYLLRISYPDQVARYQAMHVKAGRNYQGTGFYSAVGPQSDRWQWYDLIVMNDAWTYGYKGARTVSSANGFWVAFHDIGRCYTPQFAAGPAVGEMRLYELADIAASYPSIIKPQGLPQRVLMADWERLPETLPMDVARSARFMGMNVISPSVQKWGATAYFHSSLPFYVPPTQAWDSATRLSGQANADVYDELLKATKAAGIGILPRIEFGGAPKLPKAARVIGADGNIDPTGRYSKWGANILHPATWNQMEQLLDDLIGSKIKQYPQIKGVLWRMRSERIRVSYGERDVKQFCDETGRAMPSGDAHQIAQWAAVNNRDSYLAWWYQKHKAFLLKIRDKLRSYDAGLELYYYNWDPDGWHLGPTAVSTNTRQDWSDFYNLERSKDWFKRFSARRDRYPAEQYVELLKTFKRPHWNLQTQLYQNVDGIHLFAPVHGSYLADNAPYINFFNTGAGIAMSNAFTYEEKGRKNIQFDNYQSSEMTPAGEDFAMAYEIQALFHGDINVLTSTTYTFGRGFVDQYRRFAQAFLALPNVAGKVVSNATDADDVRVRIYPTQNGIYVAVIYKGKTPKKFQVRLSHDSDMVIDLVTGKRAQFSRKNGDLVIMVDSAPMSLHSYLIPAT